MKMAWGARNLISTQVYGYLDDDVELRSFLHERLGVAPVAIMISGDRRHNGVPLEGVHPTSFYLLVEVPGHVGHTLR